MASRTAHIHDQQMNSRATKATVAPPVQSQHQLRLALPQPASARLSRGYGTRPPTMPHLAHALQTKRVVNDPHDRHEQEADHVARRVMNSVSTDPHPDLAVRSPVAPFAPSTGGAPLAPAVRAFMEPRFGVDFSQVRVHTDAQAAQINEQLQARAFTHQGAIYFGAGQRPGNDPLTAHELAHVVQQGGGPSAAGGAPPAIQRAIELRPPGRGEASAFGRAQELIDRLNLVSGGLEFRLEGRALLYTVRDEAALTHFDRQMRAFIDREQLVPMRLLTHRGRVRLSLIHI